MIVMMLINKPDLLIADEPTTVLDVTIQTEILDLLCDLQQRTGMVIIFITHDLSLAEHYSRAVCIIRNDGVAERGKIKEAFTHPKYKYTAEFTNAVPEGMKEPEENNAGILIGTNNIHVFFVLERNFFGKSPKTPDVTKGISLKIKEGEALGIINESSSGRSTLSKTIM